MNRNVTIGIAVALFVAAIVGFVFFKEEITTNFLLFTLFPVIGTVMAYFLFSSLLSKSPEAVMAANEGNKQNYYMKKYPEADTNKMSTAFTLAGLVVSTLFVLYGFALHEKPAEFVDLGDVEVADEIEQLPPRSNPKPPPPPPPPPPPELEVVEDEEILEDEPEIEETDADEDQEVEEALEKIEIPEETEEEEPEEMEVEEPEEPEIFTIVEDMPEFPGGQKELFKFISKNIKYPPMARENGIEGTVYIGFVVMEDGSIEQVQVKRGLAGGGAGCDAEAIRVVNKMPKWNAGKQRGKPVRVAFTLPIRFKLE